MTNEDTEVLDNYIRDMIDGWMNTDFDFYDQKKVEMSLKQDFKQDPENATRE